MSDPARLPGNPRSHVTRRVPQDPALVSVFWVSLLGFRDCETAQTSSVFDLSARVMSPPNTLRALSPDRAGAWAGRVWHRFL